MNMVALIPARAGSKRCPGKNVRRLGGHPLIYYTIRAAQESEVFSRILVCSDDDAINMMGRCYGVESFSRTMASDDEPDIQWVRAVLAVTPCEAFSILRPTSPFRTADTICRAYEQFCHSEVHSIRAVEPVMQHPGKMWYVRDGCLKPIWDNQDPDRPFHSQPTQSLPAAYVQNASLEMAWAYVVKAFGTISGNKIAPFFTTGIEGFDINSEGDFSDAEHLLDTYPQLRLSA